MIDSTRLAPAAGPSSVADIVELVWLPAALALITAAATWIIWYYTHTVCTFKVSALTGCNAGSVAKYINIDVFGRILTYGGLVGGIGGFWRYDMIRKERAARIAAQNQLAEIQQQWQEERQGLLEELADTRRQADERAAEERERAAAECERAAEEQRQAVEDRQAFLAALSELTAEIAHLRQQRNGDTHNGQ